ncbi:MAG: enoyl-CoA hydratase/isomerase family protein [Betaproteobacteria bacterium]
MSQNIVSIERRGRIAIVRFDRRHRANSLSIETCRQLQAAARSFENDTEVSAVVLTGTENNFTMGADLKDPELLAMPQRPLAERRLLAQAGGRMCRAWEDIEALTLVAVEGWCGGGGAALALSCDLRVSANNATFYVPEIERGMNLSWNAVPRLTALVGPARAKRIIILAEKLSAAIAAEWGLVDRLSDPGGALTAAIEWAERCASLPPVQIRMLKQQVNAVATALDRAASHADYEQFMLAVSSGDFREGMRAFTESRSADYRGE